MTVSKTPSPWTKPPLSAASPMTRSAPRSSSEDIHGLPSITCTDSLPAGANRRRMLPRNELRRRGGGGGSKDNPHENTHPTNRRLRRRPDQASNPELGADNSVLAGAASGDAAIDCQADGRSRHHPTLTPHGLVPRSRSSPSVIIRPIGGKLRITYGGRADEE